MSTNAINANPGRGVIGLRRLAGSLRTRFSVLLLFMGVLSFGPWLVVEDAQWRLRGMAKVVDTAGSLRYRLLQLTLMTSRAENAETFEALAAAQRAVLQELRRLEPEAGSDACERSIVCTRLQAHAARFERELLPLLRNAMREAVHPDIVPSIVDELREIDMTVHHMATRTEKSIGAVVYRARAATLAGLFLVLLVSVGIWDVFGRVHRIAKATRGPDPENEVRAVATGSDEVTALATALAASMEETRLRNEAEREAAERRRAEQAATFTGIARMLAHEVRNPLNSMTLHAELLERRVRKLVADPAEIKSLADSIGVLRAEGKRLDQLLDSYLHLDQGRRRSFEPVDLRVIVQEVTAVHAPAIQERAITLELRLPERAAITVADRSQVLQVLHNLVVNAVDAVGEQQEKRLEIELKSGDDGWEVRVRDNGPGIGDAQKIFDPGYTTKMSGTGMGLTISRQIAVLHGGKLEARSAPDGGAVFVFWLPQVDAASALAAAL